MTTTTLITRADVIEDIRSLTEDNPDRANPECVYLKHGQPVCVAGNVLHMHDLTRHFHDDNAVGPQLKSHDFVGVQRKRPIREAFDDDAWTLLVDVQQWADFSLARRGREPGEPTYYFLPWRTCLDLACSGLTPSGPRTT